MTSEPGRPRSILVPLDGSEVSLKAERYALAIARALGSRVTLLHVSLAGGGSSGEGRTGGGPQGLLDEGAAVASAGGLQARKEEVIVTDSIVKGIVDFSSKEGIDLIVMGSRGTTGLPRLTLGSVAAGVTNAASCPVLVVK